MADNGCLLMKTKCFSDARGFFTEIWKEPQKNEFFSMLQWNLSKSLRNTIRGLHYNIRQPQAKMIRVPQGAILDVVIDLRFESPDYGIVKEYFLDKPSDCLFIPAGFAHSFWSLEDNTFVLYGCSDLYDPEFDRGISPLDTQFVFPWVGNIDECYITEKDKNWPAFDLTKKHFALESKDRFGCINYYIQSGEVL